jgi:ABC-type proline/glycine betaine transport system substrate-binding protein
MRIVNWIAAACIVKMLAVAGSALAEDAEKVRLGQIGLSFYAVTAGVVQEVLERLGHTVEVTTGSHAQIFPRLGAGEVDLLVAAWLPHGHAVYWEQYGARTLAVLRRISLGADSVAQMDYLVNVERIAPREAARVWMREQVDLVESWLALS